MRRLVLSLILPGILLSLAFVIGLSAPSGFVYERLSRAAAGVQGYSLVVHLAFAAAFVAGCLLPRWRDVLFSALMAYLSGSALGVAILYQLPPNVIVFALILGMVAVAFRNGELRFTEAKPAPHALFFGTIGLGLGFAYLHWVEPPIWINALLYSPLGSLNCPTLLALCGFLALAGEPRSIPLEATVALSTLYFGAFGLFRLNVWVDTALILCSLYLLVRIGSCLPYRETFR